MNPVVLALAALAVAPAAVVGLLLVVSIFFTGLGIPLVIAAGVAASGLVRHSQPGAINPAFLLYGLAVVELVVVAGYLFYDSSPSSALHFYRIAVIPGIATMLIAVATHATTRRAPNV